MAHLARDGMALHDAVDVNCNKAHLISNRRCLVNGLIGLCWIIGRA